MGWMIIIYVNDLLRAPCLWGKFIQIISQPESGVDLCLDNYFSMLNRIAKSLCNRLGKHLLKSRTRSTTLKKSMRRCLYSKNMYRCLCGKGDLEGLACLDLK